jgi:3-oxoacyl-[acyl-carrier protein] reductase
VDLGLKERVALVGGSSAGLGLAIATRLAAEGARVAVNGRDAQRAERAAAGIHPGAGGEAAAFPADVSDPAQAGRLVAAVAERFGRLDILVCNAGGPPATTFADAPADAWQKALDLSLLSTVHLCRAAVPLMQTRRWGRVICMTSFAALEPLPGLILSTTARAGVIGFAKCLADEVAKDGILVTTVCPGYFRTERVVDLAKARAAREGTTVEAIQKRQIGAIPVARMGDPDELASVVTFLASERASYITGAVVTVDGGYLRSID